MRVTKIDRNIEILIAGVGATQSFYLAISSFLEKNGGLKNKLLALFFFTITLRIIKSILWVYLEQTPVWFLNLGFVAHSAFGPLLLLYVYYFVYKRKWSNWNFIHFIPSLLILIFISSLTLNNFWYLGGYKMLLFHQLAYSIFSLLFLGMAAFNKNSFSFKKSDWIWLGVLTVGTTILQLTYFSNYILGLTPYLLGPVVYGVFAYFLSFLIHKNPEILKGIPKVEKYQNINLKESELYRYSKKIEFLMREEKPFLNPGFSIKQLADKTRLPVYLVSHIINKLFLKSFSDYINAYRIEEAKRLLSQLKYQNRKISSIAFECGFNSLSSFNISFKRHSGMTPSSYRNNLINL